MRSDSNDLIRFSMPVVDLANPTRFLNIVNRVLPWLIAATRASIRDRLFIARVNAPDDYQQGATVKIMFLHVPAAWLGMFGWGLMSVAALGTLVWRHPLADVAGKAAAPIGAAFTLICLITGFALGPADLGHVLGLGRAPDIDARPASALSRACSPSIGPPKSRVAARARRRCCHWSARSICRSSSSRSTGGIRCISRRRCSAWAGSTIDPALLIPLLIMALAFTLLFLTLHLAVMRNELLRRRVRSMRLLQAQRLAEARA